MCAVRQEGGRGDGRGVERDLVGARPQDVTHFVDAAYAAADRERHKGARSGAAHNIEHRRPALVSGSDVEKDDLVGALVGIAFGQFGRVAFVGQVQELSALDDAPVGDIQAGYDASGKHHATSAAGAPERAAPAAVATSPTKLARTWSPASEDFSGWNCSP